MSMQPRGVEFNLVLGASLLDAIDRPGLCPIGRAERGPPLRLEPFRSEGILLYDYGRRPEDFDVLLRVRRSESKLTRPKRVRSYGHACFAVTGEFLGNTKKRSCRRKRMP